MKIHYDPTVDALYIELHQVEPGSVESRELSNEIIADYTGDGKLAGIEILDASQFLGKEDLHKIVFEVAPALAA